MDGHTNPLKRPAASRWTKYIKIKSAPKTNKEFIKRNKQFTQKRKNVYQKKNKSLPKKAKRVYQKETSRMATTGNGSPL